MENPAYNDVESCPKCGCDVVTCNASEYHPEEERTVDHLHCITCGHNWTDEVWQ